MRRIHRSFFYLLALISLASLAAAQERTVGVQCSCDPPGTYRPPGFSCANLCAPHSSGGGGGGAPSGQAALQQQVLTGMFGAMMQGFMQGMQQNQQQQQQNQAAANAAWQAQQRAAQEAEQKRQAERRAQQEKFQQSKHEAEAELKGPGAPDQFELKDGSESGITSLRDQPAGKSVLDEALELLRRCTAADDEASNALLRIQNAEPTSTPQAEKKQ